MSALQGLMISTRAQPGCAGCSLSTDMGTRVLITYVETWTSEEDLQHQLRSDTFRRLAELLEYSSEQPTIEFTVAGTVRGLDYAEEVRRERPH